MRGPSHSGADLWFTKDQVTKSGHGAVADRIRAQARMLRDFPQLLEGVRVPESTLIDDGIEARLVMERITGPGLAIACPRWREHVARLIAFIDAELHLAHDEDVTGVVQRKLEETELAIIKAHGEIPEVRRAVMALEKVVSKGVTLPIGHHHGDLTLCNVLCDCASGLGHIALIDLSEVFVESPALDVAKVRQDTRSRWVRLFVRDVDPDILEAIDGVVRLYAFTQKGEPWTEHLALLETLQILRVVPYAAPGRVVEWALSQLRREPWKGRSS
jgi:hypothetical protein